MRMDHSQSLDHKANKTNYISTPNYEHDLAQGVHDSQQAFGLEKYGITLDQVPDEKYDWQLMALEESVDMNQYLTRELRKQTRRYEALEVTYNSLYDTYKTILEENQRLKTELESSNRWILDSVKKNEPITIEKAMELKAHGFSI